MLCVCVYPLFRGDVFVSVCIYVPAVTKSCLHSFLYVLVLEQVCMSLCTP